MRRLAALLFTAVIAVPAPQQPTRPAWADEFPTQDSMILSRLLSASRTTDAAERLRRARLLPRPSPEGGSHKFH